MLNNLFFIEPPMDISLLFSWQHFGATLSFAHRLCCQITPICCQDEVCKTFAILQRCKIVCTLYFANLNYSPHDHYSKAAGFSIEWSYADLTQRKFSRLDIIRCANYLVKRFY